MLGFQFINFGVLAKTFAHIEGLYRDQWAERFLNLFSLEKWGAVGLFLSVIGFVIITYVIFKWAHRGFSIFAVTHAATAMTLVVIGVQIIVMAIFVSMFLIRKR